MDTYKREVSENQVPERIRRKIEAIEKSEESQYEAAKWYRKAAEQGDMEAQNNLGVCYAEGTGIRQNYQEAARWFRKAAEQGHMDAQLNLGFCYAQGIGIGQNYQEAVKWFRKAAEQGNSWAQNCLGFCYDNGNGVKQNYQEAVKWYRRAAEQGNVNAQNNLGVCYAEGNGVKQDLQEAKKWFQKAAAQGNELAKKNLDEVSSSCFITTAICDSLHKPDDCYELTKFRLFRDKWLSQQADGKALIQEYYRIAPSIVASINQQENSANIYRYIWTSYLQPCLHFIEIGKYEDCKLLYIQMVRKLQKQYS